MKKRKQTTKDVQSLMNIGPAIAKRLYAIGIITPAQFKKYKPEQVYEKLKKQEGGVLDRCVLYVLQGAILSIPWWVCKNYKGEKR